MMGYQMYILTDVVKNGWLLGEVLNVKANWLFEGYEEDANHEW
jgi:hypothetical protein